MINVHLVEGEILEVTVHGGVPLSMNEQVEVTGGTQYVLLLADTYRDQWFAARRCPRWVRFLLRLR